MCFDITSRNIFGTSLMWLVRIKNTEIRAFSERIPTHVVYDWFTIIGKVQTRFIEAFIQLICHIYIHMFNFIFLPAHVFFTALDKSFLEHTHLGIFTEWVLGFYNGMVAG